MINRNSRKLKEMRYKDDIMIKIAEISHQDEDIKFHLDKQDELDKSHFSLYGIEDELIVKKENMTQSVPLSGAATQRSVIVSQEKSVQ